MRRAHYCHGWCIKAKAKEGQASSGGACTLSVSVRLVIAKNISKAHYRVITYQSSVFIIVLVLCEKAVHCNVISISPLSSCCGFHCNHPLLFFVSLQISGLFPTWQWPVNAPGSALSLATQTPAGCPASLLPTARYPRMPPSSPRSCLTRRWMGRSSWWPMAAPSPCRWRSVDQVAVVVAAAPKWPTCVSWHPIAVPTLVEEIRPVKTVGWRRSHWARRWSTTQLLLQLAKPPRGRSTCEDTALHLKTQNHLPSLHITPPSLLATTCCSPSQSPPVPITCCATAPTPPFTFFINTSTYKALDPSNSAHRCPTPVKTNQM